MGFLLPVGEYVSAQRFWCKQVSLGKETGHFFPWLITIFGEHVTLPQSTLQGPLSVITLAAIRNRDDGIYSVNASCSKGVAKGPEASGLTMKGVMEGTTRIGCLHFHHHL
jgi:hypothetical protein